MSNLVHGPGGKLMDLSNGSGLGGAPEIGRDHWIAPDETLRRTVMLNVEPKVGQVWGNFQEQWRVVAMHKNGVADVRCVERDGSDGMFFTEVNVSKFLADKSLLYDERGQPILAAPPREIQVGDCVRLKCRGPLMVVASDQVDGYGTPSVYCMWHLERGELQHQMIAIALLRHEDDDVPI